MNYNELKKDQIVQITFTSAAVGTPECTEKFKIINVNDKRIKCIGLKKKSVERLLGVNDIVKIESI